MALLMAFHKWPFHITAKCTFMSLLLPNWNPKHNAI